VTNAYFVVEPEQIVAQDLAHAIRAVDPLAEVHLFRLPDEAASALADLRPLAMILHADPGRLTVSSAGQVLLGAGIPLAFLGTEAEARPMEAEILASPFSEATVASLLGRLTARAD
jgi:hypothetical protein